jgi:hypothetical protein
MFKLQADLQDLLESGGIKCRWLGKQPPDNRWIALVSGHPVMVAIGKLSAQMAMEDTPFVEAEGLRVFREFSRAAGGVRTIEVYVFLRGTGYVVNLLRITDKAGRGEYQSLLRVKAKTQFKFADLGEALRMAMRVVSAGDETGIARVLRRAEEDMNTTQEG